MSEGTIELGSTFEVNTIVKVLLENNYSVKVDSVLNYPDPDTYVLSFKKYKEDSQ